MKSVNVSGVLKSILYIIISSKTAVMLNTGELELEVEEEAEAELEVAAMTPVQEKPWDFEVVLQVSNPKFLPTSVGVMPLQSLAENFIKPTSVGKVKWADDLFCTKNFVHTVACKFDSSLNFYLRIINSMLQFPSGYFLLVSEYEANHLLKVFWENKEIGTAHQFLHTSFVRQSLDNSSHDIFAAYNIKD